MNAILSIVIGVLFAAAVYLLLRRSILKVVMGLVILSQATNLLIFVLSKVTHGSVPLIPEGAKYLQAPYADPLPQALILTAIVISFGVLAFVLALIHRLYDSTGIEDVDLIREGDL